MIKVGSDFSGVGAFNQALNRLNIEYKEIFACDMDKYARQTFIHNYGEPSYYPENVYDREIPDESLDIYMTSPPCQTFSLAGKRGGESDKKGILFYNSHEFIKKNNPRYFIFENVKGLLSDAGGGTFNKWVQYLGGKSVNGLPTLFKHDEAVNYHLYWKVLNAKDHGIPQNRERVFLIGIRDDKDNNFSFPKDEFLEKRLRDVLQDNIDEKYYLSEKMISCFTSRGDISKGYEFKPSDGNKVASAVVCKTGNYSTDNYIKKNKQIAVKSATKKGYELASIGSDSINLEHPNSETRRGRVGAGVDQTLTTSCNQGICNKDYRIRKLTPRECFRLMDFPDEFSWYVSDSQAYKQAGNSICVGVLTKLISKLIF